MTEVKENYVFEVCRISSTKINGLLCVCALRQDPPPPEAILVIFGRRALIFFV